MRLAMVRLTMADPNSTPVPNYATPLGATPQPRMYLVERLTDKEMDKLEEDAAASSSELDESGHLDDLPATDDGLRDLRARSINQAANDSLAPPIRLLLFVSRSYASRRMLRTARELVQRIGDDRVKLAVADVEDPSSAADMAKHRITFTPTLVLETSKARTRVVGAAELREVAALIPYFYDSLID